jgi:HSP20 family molecular chaperone IbpA
MLEFQDLTTGAPAYRLPNLDVHEENGELILRAEIPGLTLGAIELSADERDLVLDADGWDGSEAGREHYEHVHGRLPLPLGMNPAQATGEIDGDVLEVHLPLA